MSLPGKSTRSSKSGRPIMALLDLVGRRWTLRVLWELRDESLSFRMLQERCDGMSPSVLNQRLAELREAQLVEAGEDGYRLSTLGRGLFERLGPLVQWSESWARQTGSR